MERGDAWTLVLVHVEVDDGNEAHLENSDPPLTVHVVT